MIPSRKDTQSSWQASDDLRDSLRAHDSSSRCDKCPFTFLRSLVAPGICQKHGSRVSVVALTLGSGPNPKRAGVYSTITALVWNDLPKKSGNAKSIVRPPIQATYKTETTVNATSRKQPLEAVGKQNFVANSLRILAIACRLGGRM
jgi:hypothetical protein